MILTMDIGNTNIKTALFDGKEMYKYWRMSTNISSTSDEYGVRLASMFAHEGVSTDVVDGIVVSSVVPTINYTIEHMFLNYFGKAPLFVAPGVRTGINIRYENPRELGSDRIANAVAAYDEYGGPCIFIDFGTAKLPRFELARPDSVIGRTTLTNLQSGMYYGYVGLVRNIVRKIRQELGEDAYVVATGGMAVLVADESKAIDKLDGLLTLKGLRLIYERNRA